MQSAQPDRATASHCLLSSALCVTAASPNTGHNAAFTAECVASSSGQKVGSAQATKLPERRTRLTQRDMKWPKSDTHRQTETISRCKKTKITNKTIANEKVTTKRYKWTIKTFKLATKWDKIQQTDHNNMNNYCLKKPTELNKFLLRLLCFCNIHVLFIWLCWSLWWVTVKIYFTFLI